MAHRSAKRTAARPRPVALAMLLALALAGPSTADVNPVPLTGLFCNTEDQLDSAVAAMAHGLTAQAAAETVNTDGVHCTGIDLLRYLIDRAVRLPGGSAAGARYRGMLVGVIVGTDLRPVSPPAEVYFITPEVLADAALERSG